MSGEEPVYLAIMPTKEFRHVSGGSGLAEEAVNTEMLQTKERLESHTVR